MNGSTNIYLDSSSDEVPNRQGERILNANAAEFVPNRNYTISDSRHGNLHMYDTSSQCPRELIQQFNNHEAHTTAYDGAYTDTMQSLTEEERIQMPTRHTVNCTADVNLIDFSDNKNVSYAKSFGFLSNDCFVCDKNDLRCPLLFQEIALPSNSKQDQVYSSICRIFDAMNDNLARFHLVVDCFIQNIDQDLINSAVTRETLLTILLNEVSCVPGYIYHIAVLCNMLSEKLCTEIEGEKSFRSLLLERCEDVYNKSIRMECTEKVLPQLEIVLWFLCEIFFNVRLCNDQPLLHLVFPIIEFIGHLLTQLPTDGCVAIVAKYLKLCLNNSAFYNAISSNLPRLLSQIAMTALKPDINLQKSTQLKLYSLFQKHLACLGEFDDAQTHSANIDASQPIVNNSTQQNVSVEIDNVATNVQLINFNSPDDKTSNHQLNTSSHQKLNESSDSYYIYRAGGNDIASGDAECGLDIQNNFANMSDYEFHRDVCGHLSEPAINPFNNIMDSDAESDYDEFCRTLQNS